MNLRTQLKQVASSIHYFMRNRGLIPPDKSRGFRILIYHSIDGHFEDDYLGIRVTPDNFLKQMEFLVRENYKVYRLQELIDFLGERKDLPRKAVAITFDDGYKDNLKNAYPVLKRFNFPATIFIRADCLRAKREKRMYYWEKWDYLCAQDLRDLVEFNKIDIGSHTVSHRRLTDLNVEEITKEVMTSKEILENTIEKPIQFFSYPHGAVNSGIKKIVKNSGYKAACSSSIGKNNYGMDLFELKRIEVNSSDNIFELRKKLSGSYDWLSFFQMRRKD